MADGRSNWLDSDQTGGQTRYAVVGEDDGSWSVIDTRFNIPVVWEDRMMTHLSFEAADDMLEIMNSLLSEKP